MAITAFRIYDAQGNEVARTTTKISASNTATVGCVVKEYVKGKRRRVWNVVRHAGDLFHTLEPA